MPRRGLTWCCRAAPESEAALSFAGLGDLLDGVLERVIAGLPPPQQNALQVALLLKDPAGHAPGHRAVCAAFLAAIRALAADGPVVIAVDDLQWLDRPSAAVLDYALRRLRGEPVGLLASARALADAGSAPPAGAGLDGARLGRLWIGPPATTVHTEHDQAANQTTRFLRYDKWQDGTLHTTELQMFRLQHWSSQEFGQLLTEAGLTGICVTADYQDARVPESPDTVWTFHATTPHAR
jgi:hypothetical protein